jgi:hypothetical protein
MNLTPQTPVRVIARCGHYHQTGTIDSIVEGQDHPYSVTGLADWALWFSAHELEPIRTPQEAA